MIAVAACARAAATKVPARHEDLVAAKLLRNVGAENLESMLGQLLRPYINKVAAGNNDVGVDVVSELVNLSADDAFHGPCTRQLRIHATRQA